MQQSGGLSLQIILNVLDDAQDVEPEKAWEAHEQDPVSGWNPFEIEGLNGEPVEAIQDEGGHNLGLGLLHDVRFALHNKGIIKWLFIV